MFAALRNLLSSDRRRFMRQFGRSASAELLTRLRERGSKRATILFSTLLTANLEFLAFALSGEGPLKEYSLGAGAKSIETCLSRMLLFSTHLFARDEFADNESELIPLLANLARLTPTQVMLHRDNLRKAPRSEEWMLYNWMVEALGGEKPAYDRELDQRFSYNYLAYIEQYRPLIQRAAQIPDQE